MKLDELTLGEIKQLQNLFPKNVNTSEECHYYEIGKNYFIRTVTHHYTGTLIAVTDHELVMENVDWIADDGRFSEAMKTGNYNEVEPFPEGRVLIGRGSIVDAHATNNKLTRRVI